MSELNSPSPQPEPQPQSEPLVPKAVSLQGVCGLTNIGNTCYGNAVLQAIRHHVDLTIFFIQDKHVPILKNQDSKAMIQSYVNLLKLMWTSTSCEKTRPFWNDMVRLAVKKSYDQFACAWPKRE